MASAADIPAVKTLADKTNWLVKRSRRKGEVVWVCGTLNNYTNYKKKNLPNNKRTRDNHCYENMQTVVWKLGIKFGTVIGKIMKKNIEFFTVFMLSFIKKT